MQDRSESGFEAELVVVRDALGFVGISSGTSYDARLDLVTLEAVAAGRLSIRTADEHGRSGLGCEVATESASGMLTFRCSELAAVVTELSKNLDGRPEDAMVRIVGGKPLATVAIGQWHCKLAQVEDRDVPRLTVPGPLAGLRRGELREAVGHAVSVRPDVVQVTVGGGVARIAGAGERGAAVAVVPLRGGGELETPVTAVVDAVELERVVEGLSGPSVTLGWEAGERAVLSLQGGGLARLSAANRGAEWFNGLLDGAHIGAIAVDADMVRAAIRTARWNGVLAGVGAPLRVVLYGGRNRLGVGAAGGSYKDVTWIRCGSTGPLPESWEFRADELDKALAPFAGRHVLIHATTFPRGIVVTEAARATDQFAPRCVLKALPKVDRLAGPTCTFPNGIETTHVSLPLPANLFRVRVASPGPEWVELVFGRVWMRLLADGLVELLRVDARFAPGAGAEQRWTVDEVALPEAVSQALAGDVGLLSLGGTWPLPAEGDALFNYAHDVAVVKHAVLVELSRALGTLRAAPAVWLAGPSEDEGRLSLCLEYSVWRTQIADAVEGLVHRQGWDTELRACDGCEAPHRHDGLGRKLAESGLAEPALTRVVEAATKAVQPPF